MQPSSVSYGVQTLKRARFRAIPNTVASGPPGYVRPIPYRPRGSPRVLADNSSRISGRFVNKYPRTSPRNPRSEAPQRPSSRSRSTNPYAGPLRGVHVAIRVKELCTTGQLDAAIEYCSKIPTALQGPVPWNTIIQAALEAKRYNFAYTQFLEVSVMFQQLQARNSDGRCTFR
jgi:hypothetical protein